MLRLPLHEPNDKPTFPGREANTFYDFGEDPDHEAQVCEILGHTWVQDTIWFKVKWELGDTTWEPLEHCNDLIQLDQCLTLQNAVNVKDLPKKGDKDLVVALHFQKRKCGKKRLTNSPNLEN
jgi:hypothetical protein